VARGAAPAFHRAQPVEIQVQRAARRDPGIQLSQAARGGIAWVCVSLLALLRRAAIQGLEGAAGQEHLAANLDQTWRRSLAQRQRHAADGAHVGGDVLAAATVATGRRLDEPARLVSQADRKAVQLWFGGVVDALDVEALPYAPVEVGDVILAECVFER
jgi:hypothetical protein